jgi:hypothetical protein
MDLLHDLAILDTIAGERLLNPSSGLPRSVDFSDHLPLAFRLKLEWGSVMPDTIPNMWPDDFKIDVQSPYTILQVQAGLLGKVTRGILQGAVETEASKDQVQHRLVVIAPAYNSYRHTLIVAKHSLHFPYPVQVIAQALAETVKFLTNYPSASSDDEMLHLVSKALHSDSTKAAILSLIAKSNESRLSPAPVPQESPNVTNGTRQENPPLDSETDPP